MASLPHETFSIIDILTERIEDADIRKSDRTRARLLRAAAELLDKSAFAQLRNIDICQQAGLAAGLLNNYFKDKHELVAELVALFSEFFKQHYQLRLAAQADEGDTFVRIYDKVDYIVRTCQSNVGLYRLFILESPELPALQSVRQGSFRFWVSDLAAIIPARRVGQTLTAKEKFAIAAMLSGMVDEAMRNAFFVDDKRPNDAALEKLITTLALLRYAAIFGADPEHASMERAADLYGQQSTTAVL